MSHIIEPQSAHEIYAKKNILTCSRRQLLIATCLVGVLPGCNDSEQQADDPLAVAVLPAAQRTVHVSTNSQLTLALSDAQPGDHIVLANGSYSRFNITKSGTQTNPIVIRAANILGASLPSGFDIMANDIICYGLSSSDYTAVGSEGSAARTRFWRCRWINGSSRFAIRLFNAPDFDAAYCEVAQWAQSGGMSAGFAFSIGHGAVRPVWRYSMFRDTTSGGDQNAGEAMHYSFGPPDARGGGLVYRCKFKNWNRPEEEELISVKCSGNVFRQLSVENSGPQAINNRFGGDNLYDAIWTRNSAGIGVFDGCAQGWGRNRVLGCQVDSPPSGDYGIMVRAGQEPPCTLILDGRNSAAGECVVSGCTGPVIVGRTYSNSIVPARGTRIRQHSGSIDSSGRLPGTSNPSHINTDSQPGVAETLYTWSPLIWLEDNDVGPLANL